MIFVVGIEHKHAELKGPDRNDVLADMLHVLAHKVREGMNHSTIKDVNGNTVGEAEYRLNGTLEEIGLSAGD
jgi:hypothetical protein